MTMECVFLQAIVRSFERSAFHVFGPATVKDLSVKRRRVLGIVKSPWAAERRRLSLQRLQSSSTQHGSVPCNSTSTIIVTVITGTGN